MSGASTFERYRLQPAPQVRSRFPARVAAAERGGFGLPPAEFVDGVAELDLDHVEIVLVHDLRIARAASASRRRNALPSETRFYETPRNDSRLAERKAPVASGVEIAQNELAGGQLLGADDQRVPRAVAIGRFEVGEELTIVIIREGRRFQGAAQFGDDRRDDGARLRSQRNRLDPAAFRRLRRAAGLQHHEKPLQTERETDGRGRRAAERRDERIVPAAAADAALRAEYARRNLEDGSTVVIETAYDLAD